ncbi:hypothetical protein D3P08_07725 [Paenibacillus nanensis]|uniref:Uncharacterized protein n=1 Tax=Paenibacillus nanensis TaxID=393251 RepID=A0A3A1V0S2_9BACL|nr:hypothetical protein [Paenibacillus nanensis]RIX54124.1 hypothetical protein D3P08_07725 [Paenibacillus nanensis]
MEELIQFLMKNFYFVLFALFILSRFLGKSKGKENEPRMPSFGGEEQEHSGRPDKTQARVRQETAHRGNQSAPQQTVYRSSLESARPEPEGGFASPELDPYADKAGQKRQKGAGGAANPADKRRPSFASLGSEASRSEVPVPEAGKRLTKQELRNAFIWSEVLGPPKAKRSYRK